MRKSDSGTDNGNVLTTGGWAIAALAGGLVYWVLRYKFGYYPISSGAFGIAIALIVLLFLRIAVSRSAPIAAPSRVRKIVPTAERAVQDQPVRAAAPVAVASAVTPMVEVPAPIPVVETPAPIAAPIAAPVEAASAAPVSMQTRARPEAAVKPKAVARTKAAAKPKAEAAVAGPVRLKAARSGGADDLKEIEGIGPALEKLVNSLGFYHFDQIGGWSDADVALVDAEMKTFRGRIARDRWVAQAKIIATEGLEAFRERAKTNNF